jgi:hypothetical protein
MSGFVSDDGRRVRVAGALLALGAMGTWAGCTAIAGIQPGELAPGLGDGSSDGTVATEGGVGADATNGDAANDATGDGAHPGADALADVRIDTSFPDIEVPDLGAPDGCTVQQADTQNGIFVAPGGATTNCGSAATPCGSITTALTLGTQAGKTIVYVAQGTYTEAITLPVGVAVRGGWTDLGGNWQPLCTGTPAATTIIQAPAGSAQAVTASYAGSSSMDTLTIHSEAPGAVGAGQAVYGVVATGATTHLTLTDVVIQVAGGGAGASGTAGAAGGGTVTCTTTGDAANGGAGSAGTAGAAGTYGATGYSAGTTAGTGGTGSPGDNGGAGSAGTTYTCNDVCDIQICSPPDCPTPVTTCSPVAGTTPTTGGPGLPGCGGNPGSGGTGGAGGGASIALFAWDATVDVFGGAFNPGNGGNGGDGAAGGAGAAGRVGVPGSGSCPNYVCSGKTCTHTNVSVGGAGGSAGGIGGAGGTGGGGAGGDSYCSYVGGAGKVNTTSLDCTPGTAGLGGDHGASNAGPDGTAAAHN